MFEDVAERDVSRARGHLRNAENMVMDSPEQVFTLAKADAQLKMGIIHSLDRLARAQETANLLRLYELPPEVVNLTTEQWNFVDQQVAKRLADSILRPSDTGDAVTVAGIAARIAHPKEDD